MFLEEKMGNIKTNQMEQLGVGKTDEGIGPSHAKLTIGMSNALDRDANGRLLPGNQLAKGNGHPSLKRLMDLRAMYMACVSPEKMIAVEQAMFELAVKETDPRVRLAACVEWLNRVLGKPTESIAVSNERRETKTVLNITAVQQQALEEIISQNRPALS